MSLPFVLIVRPQCIVYKAECDRLSFIGHHSQLTRLCMSSKQLAFDKWLELDDAVADNDDTIPDVGVTPTFS
jgi:hypothetical protein